MRAIFAILLVLVLASSLVHAQYECDPWEDPFCEDGRQEDFEADDDQGDGEQYTPYEFIDDEPLKNCLTSMKNTGYCNLPIQRGEICGERYSLEFTSSTSEATPLITRDDGSTSCESINNGNQGYAMSDLYSYELPLFLSCDDYAFRVTQRSQDDWPLGSLSWDTKSPTTYYLREETKGGGWFDDDNVVTARVTIDSETELAEKMTIDVIDGSSDSGGIRWTLSCGLNSLDLQEEEICKQLFGDNYWSNEVFNVDSEKACCGALGGEEFGERTGVTDSRAQVCTETGWQDLSMECSLSFIEANGLQITELSTSLCNGEVLRTETNNEYMAGPGSWIRASGSCNTFQLGSNSFLDVFVVDNQPNPPQDNDEGDEDNNEDPDDNQENQNQEEPETPNQEDPEIEELSLTKKTMLMPKISYFDVEGPGTCACRDYGDGLAVDGPGSCEGGRFPVCNEQGPDYCSCEYPEVDEGSGENPEANEGAPEEIDYNYWAECPYASNFNKLDSNHLGGFNFIQPDIEDSNYSQSKGMVSCSGQRLYCAQNLLEEKAEWVTDLDKQEYSEACTAYNYTATGTMCCGEPEDEEEAYNDADGVGACHRGTPYMNGEYLKDLEGNNITNVIVDHGQFMGCDVTEEDILAIRQTTDDTQLVIEKTYCAQANDYYCASNGEWVLQEEKLLDDLICAKRSIDDKELGFCEVEEQCFYDSNTGCVDDGFYEEDNHCNNGTWSTRTKMVAEKLLEIADERGGNFRLQCDEKQVALIKTDAEEQPTGPTNTYCSLKLENEEVILGAAISDVESYMEDFETAYNKAYFQEEDVEHTCSEETVDFENCLDLEDAKVYYDSTYELILISSSDESVEGTWVQNIRAWFEDLLGLERASIERLSDFDKIYIQKSDDGELKYVYEEQWDDAEEEYEGIITIERTGLNIDLNDIASRMPVEEAVVDGDILILTDKDAGSVWETVISARI